MPNQIFNLKRYFTAKPAAGEDITTQDVNEAPHRLVQDETPALVPPETPDQSNPFNYLYAPIEPEKRQNLSLMTHFSQRLNIVISQAATLATLTKQAFIEPEHLLFGLLYDAGIFKLISDAASTSATVIQDEIRNNIPPGISQATPQFSHAAKSILEEAERQTRGKGEQLIQPEHVLLAIFIVGASKAQDILIRNNITKETCQEKLKEGTPAQAESAQTLALEAYGVDLTNKARKNMLDPVIDRVKEIERTVQILSRRTKNNPVLVGEAGVGKTAIVEGLAQAIVQNNVPVDLRNRRIIALDLAALVAGASHRGEFEERLKKLIRELQSAQGEVILFIDEVHNLVGAGSGEGTLDASNILKPFLARGEIQLIGTSTIDEYRRFIEKDPALERRFQQVLVEEPGIELALQMLLGLRSKYETFHHVKIDDNALESAVKLSRRYIADRFLPDKAVDLIDEAASKIRLKAGGSSIPLVVTKDVVEEIVSAWTGIPVAKLTQEESARLLNLENLIHSRLIDQEGAVAAVADAVRRGRAGLKSTNRPIGSFLFLGPTGVGKTELAKALAETLFGAENLMIRIDMTEYMEKHEVAKLIGAPPGYVGYEEGGQLTEAIRTKPYSVVLFDEIEKAHPDVFNILIQVLEDGRLTDNKGRTVSFKNAIIIATSNIGTSLIQKEDVERITQVIHLGAKNDTSGFADLTAKLLSELTKFFKPELLNRFDEIVVFKPLMAAHMMEIATLQIKQTKKLLAEQNIELEISASALSQLAQLGFNPVFGARPLRRVIQTQIENPISRHLIDRSFKEGDTILVDYDSVQQNFLFAKKQAAPQTPYQNGIQTNAWPANPHPDPTRSTPYGTF